VALIVISSQTAILARRERIFMPNQREVAETLFERNHRREMEISQALRQEEARRAAVIENMQRLRRLRLQRDEKANAGR
jgi:hypothetical protein